MRRIVRGISDHKIDPCGATTVETELVVSNDNIWRGKLPFLVVEQMAFDVLIGADIQSSPKRFGGGNRLS